MVRSSFILLIGIGLFFLACASDPVVKSDHYTLAPLPKTWVSIENDQSDLAFKNNNDGVIFVLNSLCNKYDKTSLNDSLSDLLSGVGVGDKFESHEIMIQKRSGLEFKASGNLDGVPVTISGIIFKKNRCNYDLFLVIPRSDLVEGYGNFLVDLVNKSRFD